MSGIRPFRRAGRVRRRPRYHGPSFNRMIPNLMTMLGLCAGLTSMRFAVDERWGSAGVALVVAACIDGLDGRIARLLKATSRFGAEFDSLADFLCFGVAPAFILYLWSLHGVGAYGFAPCLMFAVCMALRLARFNAMMDASPAPAYAQSFFTGVPAPAGAGLVLFPLFAGLETHQLGWTSLYAVVHHPLFCAVVLVGTWPPCWCPPCRFGASRTSRCRPYYVLPLLLGTGPVRGRDRGRPVGGAGGGRCSSTCACCR